MTLVPIAVVILIAVPCHAVALRIAARLMVDVPVSYRKALGVVAAEYVAVAAVAITLAGLAGAGVAAIAIGAIAYLAVGALLIGRSLHLADGSAVGTGNGVLIQAIQVPLLLPVAILASYAYDAFGTAA
ncbi:MAG: hypothetical protein AB7Q97_17040 [Gammaproteobacteria bacterium]